ncbi:MAG: S1C family serine protease, partial [Spirochaetaceae bacterium]
PSMNRNAAARVGSASGLLRSAAARSVLSAPLLLLFLWSCATDAEPAPDLATREAQARDEIVRLLDDGNAAEAVQRVSAYGRSGLLETREREQFADQAVDELVTGFREAVEEGRVSEAIGMYYSLETLDAADRLEDWDLGRLYLEQAEQYVEDEHFVAALYSFGRIPDLSRLDSGVLLRYADFAREHRNRYVARKIIEELAQREEVVPTEVSEFVQSEPDAEEMISGTATVWVDRGIRLQEGLGVPDRGIGSGFFIDRRGYLVTSYHVIRSEVDPTYEGYSRLFVRLPGSSQNRVPARVVSYDRVFDVALLKVEVDPPFVFSFSNVRALRAGSRVLAIGSPGGLENSITSGIISATNRRFLQMGDALQVDVPVNPGNSGGPLLDEEGEVIGIVFAGIEQFEGVNFAIPAFWIQHFLPRLYDEGEVIHPWIGSAVHESRDGLEVMYVHPDSPARTAGLRRGDVLTSIDGWNPGKIGDAQQVLLEREPGSLIELQWRRDGETMEGYVALGERPHSPVEEALEVQEPDELFPVLFGMEAEDVSAMPWQSNYVVSRVYGGKVADETGLSEQDPFTLRDFQVDTDRRIAVARIAVKKRKAGFVESGIQLGAYLDVDYFL